MKENINITITSGTIIKCLSWIAIFAGLFYVKDFVIALLVSVVIASTVEVPTKMIMKWGLPRGLSVVIIFLTFIAIIATFAFMFIPPLADDLAHFVQTIPQILDSVRIFGKDMGFKDLSLSIQNLSRDISGGQILTVIKNALLGTSSFFATTTVFIGSITNFILTFVIAFYLSLEDRGVQKFLRLIVPKNYENHVEDLWVRAQGKIALWMQGQLLLSTLVGLLVYIPLFILNIPYALLLAVLAFIGEFIPLIGLTVAAIPALFLAWTHGGLSLLGIVTLTYIIVAQIEGNIFYPRIMSKMVGVPSVIVIIALVMGAKLAGIWGMLLSVPIAAIFMEIVSDIEKNKLHN